jgi:hypothetical protein
VQEKRSCNRQDAFETIVAKEGVPKVFFTSSSEFLGPFKAYYEAKHIMDLQNEAGNPNSLVHCRQIHKTLVNDDCQAHDGQCNDQLDQGTAEVN